MASIHSPTDFLDSQLHKSGYTQHRDGYQIQMGSDSIDSTLSNEAMNFINTVSD